MVRLKDAQTNYNADFLIQNISSCSKSYLTFTWKLSLSDITVETCLRLKCQTSQRAAILFFSSNCSSDHELTLAKLNTSHSLQTFLWTFWCFECFDKVPRQWHKSLTNGQSLTRRKSRRKTERTAQNVALLTYLLTYWLTDLLSYLLSLYYLAPPTVAILQNLR